MRATQSGTSGPAASYTWIVDRRPPAITSGPPSPSASAAATFAFAHPAYTSLQCRLDAGAWAACTSPRALTGLTPGSHTFETRALDADGVATPVDARTWTVATAAPAITAQPANPTSQATATFAFAAAGFTRFSCRLDGAAFTACDAGTITYGPIAPGAHTFTVRAIDGAGNATADAVVTWTVQAPPTITILNLCTIGGNGRDRVIGTTNRNNGSVAVRFYAGPAATGTPVATLTTNSFQFGPFIVWTVQTAAGQLTPGATYTAQAQQTDATGGVSNTPSCTFVAS